MDATVAAAPERAAIPRRRDGVLARVVRHRADYLYVTPAIGVMLLVIGYPIYFTIYLSFFSTPPSLALSRKIFVGAANYTQVVGSDAFQSATLNTVIWTLASTFFAFALGLAAAIALDRPFPGRGILRGVLLVPYVISAVPASYIWRWLYHSDFGVIGALAMASGVSDRPLNFLDNTDTVLASLIVVNVWKEFPFAMIMILAGLQTVPEYLHRAALMDGAGPLQRFWHVTLPHLKNVVVVTLLLMLVANLNSFTIPFIMTGGGPAGASDIWITQIYNIAFGRIRFGLASAYSVILFVIMMVLGWFYVRALTREPARAAA